MNHVQWIDPDCLESHFEKHVKYCNPDEATEWNHLYAKKYEINRELLLEQGKDEQLKKFYEAESIKVHQYRSKIYLYYDKRNGNYKVNISRKKDNLVIGEIIAQDHFNISTCFFKKNEFIDTEILKLLIQFDNEFQKKVNSTYENVFRTLILSHEGVYIYKNKKLESSYSDVIVGIPNISALTKDETQANLYRRRYVARNILVAFLKNQQKYRNGLLYGYLIDYFSNHTISRDNHLKIKKNAQSNLKKILEVYGWSKNYDEYIEYTEMSVIFYLVCLYASCNELKLNHEYDTQYNEVEKKILNTLPDGTKNYEIIKNLLYRDLERTAFE